MINAIAVVISIGTIGALIANHRLPARNFLIAINGFVALINVIALFTS